MIETGKNQYAGVAKRVSAGINEKIKAYEDRIAPLAE